MAAVGQGTGTGDPTWRAGVEAGLAAGERLTAADGVALFGCDDLSWLGGLAHARRTAAVGDRTSFVVADVPVDDVPTRAYGRDTEPAELVAGLLAIRDAADTEPARLVVLVREGGDDTDAAVSPAESMKLFAIARLLLDNVADLGIDLASHAPSTAALLAHFGASALLVPVEGFDATATAELIWDAGLTPVQVGTDGGEVRDFGPAATQAQRRSEPQSVFA